MGIRAMKISAVDFSTPLAEMRLRENLLIRFKDFIEHSDWDERILSCQKWLDAFCWGFVVLSIVFLLPTIVHILH
jgi:hypothetical protein